MSSSTTTTASVSDLLGRPLDGVARLVIRHQRLRSFRWVFLIEVALFIVLICCLIPFLVLAVFLGRDGDSELSLPSFEGRAFHHWHEIALELVGPEGKVINTVSERPASQTEGNALICSILEASSRENLVVIEMIGREVVATWFGGQPLFADPSVVTNEVARRVFARARGGAGPVAAVDADAAEERGARGGGDGWVRDHPARVGVGGAVAMTRVTRGTRLR